MIISVAIVTGFQREITNKVTGFDAHLKVVSLNEGSDQYNKLIIDHVLLEKLKRIQGVERIELFAQQPGIVEFDKEIHGVMIKGVESTFDGKFFDQYLISGKLPDFNSAESNEILISETAAKKLGFKVGDKLRVYFVSGSKSVNPRSFKVSGIYKTGLQNFDEKMVFISLGQLQRVKNYGLQAFFKLDSINGVRTIEALAFGGDKNYRYKWSLQNWEGKGPHVLDGPKKKKKVVKPGSGYSDVGEPMYTMMEHPISLVVSDGSKTIPDTAFILYRTLKTWSSGGSDKYYADGYDIYISDFKRLKEIEEEVDQAVGYNLTTTNVISENPEIFNWLEILDVNVYIIIILLSVVAVINMCSALLILILERANMIGILKAIGAANYSIRKIFLYNGALLITRGLFWGNVIALVLLLFQQLTGFVTLPGDTYYIKEVPVNINILHILILNIATIIVSMIVLLLPSLLISKLSPAKTIRFE